MQSPLPQLQLPTLLCDRFFFHSTQQFSCLSFHTEILYFSIWLMLFFWLCRSFLFDPHWIQFIVVINIPFIFEQCSNFNGIYHSYIRFFIYLSGQYGRCLLML
jgi:hypothetical protein